MSTIQNIERRHKAYSARHPSPVVTRQVADTMHDDIGTLLELVAQLKAER